MARSLKIIFLVELCLCFSYSEAQNTNTLFFMKDVPASIFINPAFSPEGQIIIGAPFISGFNVGYNNDFRLNEVTKDGYGIMSDTLKFDFDSFSNIASERNRASFETRASMFYFGIRDKKNFYSIYINEKAWFRGEFDKQFIDFFKNGVKSYYGSDSEIGNLSFSISQYREFGLGISRKMNKKLDMGASLKVLFGRLNMASEGLTFQATTSPGNEKLEITPSGSINISGPVRFETDTVENSVRLRNDLRTTDYLFNFKNLGVAADLGINYRYSRFLSFSASITDLGFLRFSKKNYILDASSAIEYKREDLTQSTEPGAYDYYPSNSAMYAFRDSIPFMTTSANPSSKAQFVPLPVKVYLGADYILDKEWGIGFVGKLFLLKNYFYSSATIAAKRKLSEKSTISFSNTVIRKSILNPGVGWSYKSEQFHFFAVADNILGLVVPSSLKNLNLQVGINLLINNE